MSGILGYIVRMNGLARTWSICVLSITILWTICSCEDYSCNCWEGYKIEETDNGPQCVAVDNFHIMPCDVPKSPKCVCSGEVNSILKDKTGTWCTKYSQGHELMRWPCENIKEWDDFFRENPLFAQILETLCHLANPPKCECVEDYSNIIKDHTGTFCAKYSNNIEEKRWPCENAMEWKEYWKNHSYYVYC